jgi:hypothetical protein
VDGIPPKLTARSGDRLGALGHSHQAARQDAPGTWPSKKSL